VNNDDSVRPSLTSPSAASATDAGRARRSQSTAPSDDDYLVPQQNHSPAKYLDFPDAEPGNYVFYSNEKKHCGGLMVVQQCKTGNKKASLAESTQRLYAKLH